MRLSLWAPRGHPGTHSPDICSFTLSCGSLAHRRKSRLLSAWPSRPHKARPTPTLARQTRFLSTSCSLSSPSRCVHAAGLLPQPFTEAAPAPPSGPTSGFRPRPQAKAPCAPLGLHTTTAGFGGENRASERMDHLAVIPSSFLKSVAQTWSPSTSGTLQVHPAGHSEPLVQLRWPACPP